MNSTKLSHPFPFIAPGFAYLTPTRYTRPSMNSAHTQARDFHLDTFFNPIWMSGPNVFRFNADGTIESPKTKPAPLAPLRHNGNALSVHKTYAAAAKSTLTQGLSLSRGEMSPLPSMTNAAVEAVPVREMEDDNLVYTWPPNLAIYQKEVLERGSGDAAKCADENVATELYGASPTVTASTESPSSVSSMIATPTQSESGTCVLFGSPQRADEGALEKITGLKRLRCKAPPPLCLRDNDGGIGRIGCILLDRDGEPTAHEAQVSLSYYPSYTF
jgi:hypothetical protein